MLKEYKLPNGTLWVNTDDSMIEHIIDGGVPIEILPKKAHMSGDLRGVPIEEYFACPEIWETKWETHQAIKKSGSTIIAIDASQVKKWGDQIMLTILPKAFRETWNGKAKIDIVTPRGYEAVWENNPYVRNVSNVLNKKEKYDKVMDVTGLGLKFRRPEDAKCADAILSGLGLDLINKAPILVLTEKERKWAEGKLGSKKSKLIGVSLYSSCKSRTYPHMLKVVKILKTAGYEVIILDEKIDGEFRYSFREAVALVERCNFIVTTDSCFLHIAGAFKKRMVGIFGYTDGKVLGESYEKFSGIQSSCPYGEKEPCWWDMKCIPGPKEHLARTNLDHAHCLKKLEPEVVAEKVEEVFTKPKSLLLVMLTYNCFEMTKKAVESIRSWHNYDLFVVDNESTDGTQKWLKEKSIDSVSKKTSVAAAQNIGIERFLEEKDKYDYLIFLNNDIVLKYDMLDKLVICAKKSKAYGIMGTQVNCSRIVDSVEPEDDKWTEIVDIPAGSYSATLFTRECIEKVGTFNERYKPRYIEDNDYTLRIRASGGKFVKSHDAIFWHYLGAVIKTVEKSSEAASNKYWWDNTNIFREMYGIHPHKVQDLDKLGLEWHREDWVVKIRNFLKIHDRVKIRVERKMGGYGDILFITAVAKALKFLFKNKVEVNYFVPEEFIPLLKHNSNIDEVYDCHNSWKGDFIIDLTDLEFRVELQEMREYGCIKSARTQIYLDVLGLSRYLSKSGDWLKPDYFVTKEEKIWAEKTWKTFLKGKQSKRIAFVCKGSNKLKCWPYAQDLIIKLLAKGYSVYSLDNEDGDFRFDFRKSAAMVATSDLVISPDSGISNLAGALNKSAITIFSNRNGENFAKMFKTMIPIQGNCSYNKKNYCDFFCPCIDGGAGPHRAKENIKVPKCLENLTVLDIEKVIQKELK